MLCVAVAIFEWALLCIAAFVFANPVGAGTIFHLQGRYFIPVSPLLLLPLYGQRVRARINETRIRQCVGPSLIAMAVVSGLVTVYSVATRYYVG